MKIDTSKIDGYAEMSAEEKLAALEAYEYEDNAVELEKAKNALSKANSEAAAWKKKHNERLSEDEKAAQERNEEFETMKKAYELLKHEKLVSEYKASFLAQGYSEENAVAAANAVADNDMPKFFEISGKAKDDLITRTKAELIKNDPRPDGAGSDEGAGKKTVDIELAEKIGKSSAAANKTANDIMNMYTGGTNNG